MYFESIVMSYFFQVFYAFFAFFKNRANTRSYKEWRAHRIYPDYLKQGEALASVRPLTRKFCFGNGLDIGAGVWPLENARPIEDNRQENAYKIKENNNSVDFVFSSHTLEHLEDPGSALKEWVRVIKPEGVLFLYLPHPACEMWRVENLPFHHWNPDPVVLEQQLIKDFSMSVLYATYLPDGYQSFVLVLKKAK